jgi:hypothetical protein
MPALAGHAQRGLAPPPSFCAIASLLEAGFICLGRLYSLLERELSEILTPAAALTFRQPSCGAGNQGSAKLARVVLLCWHLPKSSNEAGPPSRSPQVSRLRLPEDSPSPQTPAGPSGPLAILAAVPPLRYEAAAGAHSRLRAAGRSPNHPRSILFGNSPVRDQRTARPNGRPQVPRSPEDGGSSTEEARADARAKR